MLHERFLSAVTQYPSICPTTPHMRVPQHHSFHLRRPGNRRGEQYRIPNIQAVSPRTKEDLRSAGSSSSMVEDPAHAVVPKWDLRPYPEKHKSTTPSAVMDFSSHQRCMASELTRSLALKIMFMLCAPFLVTNTSCMTQPALRLTRRMVPAYKASSKEANHILRKTPTSY